MKNPTKISPKHYKFSCKVTKLVRKYFNYEHKYTNTYVNRDTTKYLKAIPKSECSLHALETLLANITYFLSVKYDPEKQYLYIYSESKKLTKKELKEKKKRIAEYKKLNKENMDKYAQKYGFKNDREYNKFLRDNEHQSPEWRKNYYDTHKIKH